MSKVTSLTFDFIDFTNFMDIKVSIIMPTYNPGEYMKTAIDSALMQTFRDFELLIVDDGSTTDLPRFLEKARKVDDRIRCIHQPNRGVGLARDFGLRSAMGEYIAFLDDDDFWISAKKLQTQVSFMDQNEDYILVGSTHNKVINESGNFLRNYDNPGSDEEIRKKMLRKNCFLTSSVMFRKKNAIEAGGFTDMRLAEDYDLWLRLGHIGKMANIDECDITYRQRLNSASSRRRAEMYQVTLSLVRKYGHDYPGYLKALAKAYTRIITHALLGDKVIQRLKSHNL